MSAPRETLVTRESLETLIDSIAALEPYRAFLKGRWVGMVLWWHGRSMEARRMYFRLRAAVVLGGVSLPVLAVLSQRPGWAPAVTMAMALVSALVAGAAAWEGVANYGDTWREKRRAAELLKVEGWQFLQLCGRYQADGTYVKAFPHFAAEVEVLVAREVGEYLAVFEPSVVQARRMGGHVLESLVAEARR